MYTPYCTLYSTVHLHVHYALCYARIETIRIDCNPQSRTNTCLGAYVFCVLFCSALLSQTRSIHSALTFSWLLLRRDLINDHSNLSHDCHLFCSNFVLVLHTVCTLLSLFYCIVLPVRLLAHTRKRFFASLKFSSALIRSRVFLSIRV